MTSNLQRKLDILILQKNFMFTLLRKVECNALLLYKVIIILFILFFLFILTYEFTEQSNCCKCNCFLKMNLRRQR